jgi:predicted DCC family thiol-disulfide oxidoreductase YuxK
VQLPTLVLTVLLAVAPAVAQTPAAGDLKSQISQLAALDYGVRMNAARQVRRVAAAEAVPALTDAVKNHTDQFVRYRALVMLTAFGDRGTGVLMRSLLTDKNDRLREVACRWLEQHPDPTLRFALTSALQNEQAEFVRPAVVAALASLAEDPDVQRLLTREVTSGLDFFRSAAIDTLGHHRAAYALDAIAGVSLSDGPLQSDAVLALGRIGGSRARAALDAVTMAPADVKLTLLGARCLLGDSCDTQIKTLADAALAPKAPVSMVRAAVMALSALAISGQDAAFATLVGISPRGQGVRDQAAVALAAAAVREPARILAWLNAAPANGRAAAIALLKDGFDGLDEDFAEEQFFAAARASYWSAADGSSARSLAATLIQDLEF